jgi:hypothetical protein
MSTSNSQALIRITAYDGTRSVLNTSKEMLVTVTNGPQGFNFQRSYPSTQVTLAVPFHDGPGDIYAVTAWVDGYQTAGFPTVQVTPQLTLPIDIMLLPKDANFKFFDQDFDSLQRDLPKVANLFGAGQSSSDADGRYQELLDKDPAPLACFLNITTAMSQIQLPQNTALDYMKQIIWDDPTSKFAQDRFFGYADKALINQVALAANQKIFAPDPDPFIFHQGATLSYKQIQLGEANVQLTFHQNDPVPNPDWVKIEPDIDYYKDVAAHGLFEVIPNAVNKGLTIGTGLTDPKQVYVLRWIGGRYAGFPEFNPPYEII